MSLDNDKIYRIEQHVNIDASVDRNNANQFALNHIIYAVNKMLEEHPTAELKVRTDIDWYDPVFPHYVIMVEGRVQDGDE